MKSPLAAVKRSKIPCTGQPMSAWSIYSWSRTLTQMLATTRDGREFVLCYFCITCWHLPIKVTLPRQEQIVCAQMRMQLVL